ncbi:MAG: response regulator [Deferribacterales bacterium]|uniref:response regulator n=1 Tax=Deferrivibrio essentukiensis TaxID=2880922 RepID=UPI0019AB7817|nr:response regulator [Deferribacterales bacterium]MBZ4672483.1 response regulator receiver protein [Deferribacteraceae bacterium]MCB4204461.1 response regulator [Deferrivibrio essentukiensis]
MITVLIVDDDSNIRLLLRDEFCELGFNTITAVDGEEALISFSEENIDLVILDIRMPKVDGKKVLEEIKKVDVDVPVILYTANPYDIDDYKKYKNVELVIKGADLTELKNTVKKYVNV